MRKMSRSPQLEFPFLVLIGYENFFLKNAFGRDPFSQFVLFFFFGKLLRDRVQIISAISSISSFPPFVGKRPYKNGGGGRKRF